MSLKKRVINATYRDGLFDLAYGMVLSIMGLSRVYDRRLLLLALPLMLLMAGLLKLLKKKIVFPRAGYVKIESDTGKELKGVAKIATLAVGLLTATLVFTTLSMGREPALSLFREWILPVSTIALYAIGPLWLARNCGLKRGYVLASLIVLTGWTLAAFGFLSGHAAVGAALLAGAAFSILTGSVLLTRFLKNNPHQEMRHGKQ